MKFDVIVGNPPYNAPQNADGKRGGGDTLWDKFVVKSMDLLKDKGYLCLVHPMGWRAPVGDYTDVRDSILLNNLLFLSMNDAAKGQKVFGAGTAYDYFVCQKAPYGGKTKILDFDEKLTTMDLTGKTFIPNGMFDEISSLIAGPDEERVETSNDCNYRYESRQNWVSHEPNKEFKYPVVHGVSVENVPSFIYSNTKRKGHFGIPKVIFGRRTCGTFIDYDGKYACSQHTSYLVSMRNNLENINRCLQSKKFIKLMSYGNWNSTAADRYNHRLIALFRKDFWKEFVNADGTEKV